QQPRRRRALHARVGRFARRTVRRWQFAAGSSRPCTFCGLRTANCEQPMRLRVVLVEPKEAGNVGAAARAMKNFGFSELALVGARPQITRDASEWWAKGGADVAQSATHFATLQEALADVHLSIATTAVRGRHVYEQLTPVDVARLAEQTLG